MRALADNGHALVFISHKLNEVRHISDRVTILRKGECVHTCDIGECSIKSLASMMVGDKITYQVPDRIPIDPEPLVELEDVYAKNDRGLRALSGVNLVIGTGEIVGLAGVAGNGQTELSEVLTGLRKIHKGSIFLDGQDITEQSARIFARSGIGHIPADRIGTGLVADDMTARNAVLREYSNEPICKKGGLRKKEINRVASEIVKEGNVAVPSINVAVRNLSGGNQQRLVVRREVRTGLKVLVAVHPTRGLDVGAIEAVQKALIEHRNNNCGILLISEDLDELMSMSDRIIVIYEGSINGEFKAEEADREKIGLLMSGIRI